MDNVLLSMWFHVVNNIVQYCYTRFGLNNINYCLILLTTITNFGSKTLFNPVTLQAFQLHFNIFIMYFMGGAYFDAQEMLTGH